jgi:hypothetical protein
LGKEAAFASFANLGCPTTGRRLSEFVESTAAPLQLVKSQRQTAARIAELARQLGIGG